MEGAKVYVKDASAEWQKATVVAALGAGKYRVQLEAWEGAENHGTTSETVEFDACGLEGGTLPFQNSNMPDGGFPDMTTLDHLHEAALLHNLRVRFMAGTCPYTYTADIVIAVNPYKWLPEIYTDEMRKEYLVFDKKALAPHVYATSSAAYSDLQEAKIDQSILVSGESGAGKTETVKILMGHLALIASSDDTTVIERIVKSNPLLESFGNAQTVRNDNSSRFGKFIELELNEECRLVGSRCRTFLLEKSRVVGQDAGERNYHIFYQMLAINQERRAAFGLGRASQTRDSMRYTCMGKSPIQAIEGKTDAQCFENTCEALALVGIEGETLTRLMRAIASVLLLGQLDFDLKPNSDQESGSRFKPGSEEQIADVASALSVRADGLEQALTQRTIKSGRDEKIVKQLPPGSAAAGRDAIAKELYLRLFDWLVARICAATTANGMEGGHTVGLLDIFGFESFAINRFEQLCINYANEKLQQKFTLDIFKAVQQEYTNEGIPWEKVEFKDNAPVLALIEAKLGIIAMLNEECVRPKGSDANFVSKMVSVHREDPAFSIPKLGKEKEVQFSVKHYAGSVMYTTTGWLERNKDVVSDDLASLMRASENPLIAEIFAEVPITESTDAKAGRPGANTVATKFKSSLAALMDTVNRTRTQYVRCIKPNKQKSATKLENTMVLEQLRCAGVIEAIRISRAGFPARMPLKEFSLRFAVLVRAAAGLGFSLRGSDPVDQNVATSAAAALNKFEAADSVVGCRALMSALAPGQDDEYEIGKTRMYFKMGVLEKLEERRALLRQGAATVLASCVRGRRARRRFTLARRAALRLQSLLRMHRERSQYLKVRRCAVAIQAFLRGVLARRYALMLRRECCATKLQSCWRRCRSVREYRRVLAAVVRVQARARRNACRRQYLVDLKEFKEQAKLENQVKALQSKLAALEGAGTTSAEPPTEILEALETLTTENQKLRTELEKVKAENLEMRNEIKELRAERANKADMVTVLQWNKKEERDTDHRRDRTSGHNSPLLRSQHVPNVVREPATATERPPLQYFPPLSEFWIDMPCADLPSLANETEIHIKFGANILMVDETTRELKWQKCLPNSLGYHRSMAFNIERRSDRQPASRMSIGGTLDAIGEALGPSCIGQAFALRSTLTGQYVCAGGIFQRYCMQVSGDKPDDAAVFTFVAQEGADKIGTVESHFFALKLVSEKKMLSLRKDGYVTMTAVLDKDSSIVDDTMAACVEVLLPCNAYEITIDEKQIGIIVGKDLPLTVVGFRSAAPEGSPYEPGPAERTGRVHVGDTITSVNGMPLEDVPRQEALAAINNARPVTLGFNVKEDGHIVEERARSTTERRRSLM